MDLFDLKKRTKDRDATIWGGISPASLMGIPDILSSCEDAFDGINENLSDTMVAVVDDTARIKEENMESLYALGQAKIQNEKQITDMNIENERKILELERATNDYIILVDRYINDVEALLMSAKEYALALQWKTVDLGLARAEVAEEKAVIKIARIDMQIDLEIINRKFVEIEVLRAELNLAKADVRMVMTQINMEEAELDVIRARVDKAMMAVDKVKLEADIALIFADIATRQLTETRYNVENAEIVAGFTWIADKLASLIAIMDQRQLQTIDKSNLQKTLIGVESQHYTAQRDNVSTGLEAAQRDQSVQEHEQTKTDVLLALESSLKAALQAAEMNHLAMSLSKTQQVDSSQLEAAAITKQYETQSSTSTRSVTNSRATITQVIS